MNLNDLYRYIPYRKVTGSAGETGVPCLLIIEFVSQVTVTIVIIGMSLT